MTDPAALIEELRRLISDPNCCAQSDFVSKHGPSIIAALEAAQDEAAQLTIDLADANARANEAEEAAERDELARQLSEAELVVRAARLVADSPTEMHYELLAAAVARHPAAEKKES